MNLDELELELRRLPGVASVGFVESVGLLVVELQVTGGGYPELARDATRLAIGAVGSTLAVEVVRWGDGEPRPAGRRLRLVSVGIAPPDGEVTVVLDDGAGEATGRAPASQGLLATVDATVSAVRHFVPALPYSPGWARTIETTPQRTFLVVASVTDPAARVHRRGAAEGRTPVEAAARATLAALNRTIAREL